MKEKSVSDQQVVTGAMFGQDSAAETRNSDNLVLPS